MKYPYITFTFLFVLICIACTGCDVDKRLKPIAIEETLPNAAIEIESRDSAFYEGHFYVIKHKETGKRFLYINHGGNIALQPLN